MIVYSQRDGRWANDKIGNTNLTIGRFGCTISSIAMLSTYFGDNLTPQQVNAHCKFTVNGLVYWNSCRFNTFLFDRREYGRNDVEIAKALKDPNRAVILQVAHASHWVVAISKLGDTSIFRIADPFFGDRADMTRYANNITGAAYFRRK